MKIFFVGILFVCVNSFAEIPVYESTDNTGINKAERIDTVESYLAALSKSVKTMESKLDENAKKISNLDSIVKAMVEANKASAEKLAREKLGEKKVDSKNPDVKEIADIEKIKTDIMALKNEDLEKMKAKFIELDETVKAIQATLHDQIRLNSGDRKFGTKPQ